MPMGIVSNRDWELEINNSCVDSDSILDSNLNNDLDKSEHRDLIIPEVLDMPTVGRHSGVSNVPDSLRKVLADDHLINGLQSAKRLADSFGGLSQPTLSTFRRGETSPKANNKKSDDLTEFLNGRKAKISKRALNKINLALNHLDEDKFLELSARDISGVAKDMAIVAKQMEPTVKENTNNQMNGVQFIMYAPVIKSEQMYETVTAKDNY